MPRGYRSVKFFADIHPRSKPNCEWYARILCSLACLEIWFGRGLADLEIRQAKSPRLEWLLSLDSRVFALTASKTLGEQWIRVKHVDHDTQNPKDCLDSKKRLGLASSIETCVTNRHCQSLPLSFCGQRTNASGSFAMHQGSRAQTAQYCGRMS